MPLHAPIEKYFPKLFRLESNAGKTVGGCRCTVARDVLKCLLEGSLASQHHSADAFANIQKLFQLAALSSVGSRQLKLVK